MGSWQQECMAVAIVAGVDLEAESSWNQELSNNLQKSFLSYLFYQPVPTS